MKENSQLSELNKGNAVKKGMVLAFKTQDSEVFTGRIL